MQVNETKKRTGRDLAGGVRATEIMVAAGARELRLRGGRPSRVITDTAVLGFDPVTHSGTLLSLHPGVRFEEMLGNPGFPVQVPEQISATPLPTPEQLRPLREKIDPKGAHLK